MLPLHSWDGFFGARGHLVLHPGPGSAAATSACHRICMEIQEAASSDAASPCSAHVLDKEGRTSRDALFRDGHLTDLLQARLGMIDNDDVQKVVGSGSSATFEPFAAHHHSIDSSQPPHRPAVPLEAPLVLSRADRGGLQVPKQPADDVPDAARRHGPTSRCPAATWILPALPSGILEKTMKTDLWKPANPNPPLDRSRPGIVSSSRSLREESSLTDYIHAQPPDPEHERPTERLAGDLRQPDAGIQPAAPDYLEYEEAMRILGLSQAALFRFVRDGSIRAFRIEGRMKFLRDDAVGFRDTLEREYLEAKADMERHVWATCPKCGTPNYTMRSDSENREISCETCGHRFPVRPSQPIQHLPSLVLGTGLAHPVEPADSRIAGGGTKQRLEGQEGQDFRRYRLLQKLGNGAMGVVWKAEDPLLGRVVALKRILQEEHDDEIVQRFLREARLAAHLSHRNIAAVYDAGVDGGQLYFTMEYVEGITLQKAMARRTLPTGEALSLERLIEIAKSVADALAYAHAQGIIHRDVKPSNVLLDLEGKVKLADFGLALALGSSRLTAPGNVLGTPAYMAPEQVQAMSPTPAIDVYSLGVLLFEMITGKLPFNEASPWATAMKRVQEDAAFPDSWPESFELQFLVMKCLQRKPECRPTAREAADSLGRILADRQGRRRFEDVLRSACCEIPSTRIENESWLVPTWGVVIVATLRGFPLESTPEHEWDQGGLLSEYYRWTRSVVQSLRGSVIRLQGGSIFALFMSREREEAIHRALIAVISLREEMPGFPQTGWVSYVRMIADTEEAARAKRDGMLERVIDGSAPSPLNVQLSICIHAGDLLVGPVHDGDTHHLVALGEAVEVASHLLRFDRPGGFVVTDDIAREIPSAWRSVRKRRVTLLDGRQFIAHDLEETRCEVARRTLESEYKLAWQYAALSAISDLADSRDLAFLHLEHYIAAGGVDVTQLREDPNLRALHDDPRWMELLAGRLPALGQLAPPPPPPSSSSDP